MGNKVPKKSRTNPDTDLFVPVRFWSEKIRTQNPLVPKRRLTSGVVVFITFYYKYLHVQVWNIEQLRPQITFFRPFLVFSLEEFGNI